VAREWPTFPQLTLDRAKSLFRDVLAASTSSGICEHMSTVSYGAYISCRWHYGSRMIKPLLKVKFRSCDEA